HFRGSCGSVGIDDLLQDLLELFLSNMEIYLKQQLVSFLLSVYKSKILWNDLIKQESSQCRLDHTALYGSVRHSLVYADFDLGMKGNCLVLISQQRLIDALERFPFSFCPRTLLGQIIDTQYHILRRHRNRAS